MRNFLTALAVIAPVVAVAAAGMVLQDRVPSSGEAEGPVLAASGELAHREGPSLALIMETGAVIVLTDRITCGDLSCPGAVTARFRYRGWDANGGGYRVDVGNPPTPAAMLLPWDMPWDRPALIDADHAPPRSKGPLKLPPPPPAVAPDIGLADWLGQAESDRDPVESPHLSESAGRVTRTGATLTIKLGNGRLLALTDDLVCGQLVCPPQTVQAFEYLGASPDHRFHVVADHWYEGGLAMMIDATTGVTTVAAGPPRFSPDGKRAAASALDPESRGPRDLEIWSLAGTAPALEFAVKGGAGQDLYEIVGWDDTDHLRLRRGPVDASQRIPTMLAHTADGWHLEGGD